MRAVCLCVGGQWRGVCEKCVRSVRGVAGSGCQARSLARLQGGDWAAGVAACHSSWSKTRSGDGDG